MMHQRKSRGGAVISNSINTNNVSTSDDYDDDGSNIHHDVGALTTTTSYYRSQPSLSLRHPRRPRRVMAPWNEWMLSICIFGTLFLFGLMTIYRILPVGDDNIAAIPTISRSNNNEKNSTSSNEHDERIRVQRIREQIIQKAQLKMEEEQDKIQQNNVEQDDDEATTGHSQHFFVDQSPWYKQLRQDFDSQHKSFVVKDDYYGNNKDLVLPLLEAVQKLRSSTSKHSFVPINTTRMTYNVNDCPRDPPPNYPIQFPIVDILTDWNPDDVFYDNDDTKKYTIYQGICVFDYYTPNHYEYASNYRLLEVPFVLKNHPHVLPTVIRWNTPTYLQQLLRDTQQRTEYSKTNHFMFWRLRGQQKQNHNNGWKPPTDNIMLSYSEWVAHAESIIANTTTNATKTTNNEYYNNKDHWYFRLNGCISMQHEDCEEKYLFDELPFFQPELTSTFFIVDSAEYRGVNCRFGMAGAIAENHFDASRNMVVVLGGQRRYILSRPSECSNFALLPKSHPSGRHSAVDFSNLSSAEDRQKYPNFFNKATANEVVLEAGDVLYLPTYWMHYIISLTNLNFQCNCRSGMTHEFDKIVRDCGF